MRARYLSTNTQCAVFDQQHDFHIYVYDTSKGLDDDKKLVNGTEILSTLCCAKTTIKYDRNATITVQARPASHTPHLGGTPS